MQTFLPYLNFAKSVRILDSKRLGKQRVETLQIMSALMTGSGWINHPAVRMWKGYEWALLHYQKATFEEWVISRGHQDTCLQKTLIVYFTHAPQIDKNVVPPWLGNSEFHISHQSNLIRKKPEYYGALFPNVSAHLPYIWPSHRVESLISEQSASGIEQCLGDA